MPWHKIGRFRSLDTLAPLSKVGLVFVRRAIELLFADHWSNDRSGNMLSKLFLIALLCGLATKAEEVVTVTGSNFEEVVKEGTPVVLEFYAPWCGHCKKLAPEYERAAQDLKTTDLDVVLAKCDATDKASKDLASKYGIRGYPTIKIFKNGPKEDPIDYAGPRDAEGISAYLTKLLGPASTALTTAESIEEFLGDGTKALGVFASEDAPEFEVFLKLADKLRDALTASHTFDASLVNKCEEEKCEKATVMVAVPEDGLFEIYEGEFEDEQLESWLKKTSAPKLPELGQSPRMRAVLQEIFQNEHPRLFGFTKKDYEKLDELKSELISVNEENDEVDVMLVDIAANARAAQFFALTDEEMPALVLHDHTNNAKYIKKQIEPADIKQFVASFHEGALTADVKSEEPPKSNDGPVRVVVGNTFKEEVMNAGKSVLIEFYAPWCGHCKKLAPIFDKVGAHFKDNDKIVIAKMDATANDIPDGRFQVKAYPTIKLVRADGEIESYEGNRTFEAFRDFINKEIEGDASTDEVEEATDPVEDEPQDKDEL